MALALLLVATGAVAPHAQGRGQGSRTQRRADRAMFLAGAQRVVDFAFAEIT